LLEEHIRLTRECEALLQECGRLRDAGKLDEARRTIVLADRICRRLKAIEAGRAR
jgi:hypothetical protein